MYYYYYFLVKDCKSTHVHLTLEGRLYIFTIWCDPIIIRLYPKKIYNKKITQNIILTFLRVVSYLEILWDFNPIK